VDDLDRAGGIEQAISAIGRGGLAIVVDSATGEGEGDLVMAAEHASAEAINFMVTHGRGLVCVPMLANRLQELAIPPIPSRGIDPLGTAFHISVDYLPQTTTGISAADRAATARALAGRDNTWTDFVRPGHLVPLCYAEGGVLSRAGHTEAAIDLVKMAGCAPVAVICDILSDDGRMARGPELLELGDRHGLPVITIAGLGGRRLHEESIGLDAVLTACAR